jgi:putative PIN family toxin of toxin-antitoxin system
VRILLDTNILVRAAISPGGLARGILDLIRRNDDHVLVISSYILSEVADVLSRPRIRTRWPLSDHDIQAYCQTLSSAAEEVSIRQLTPAIADPKDQAIIEAAIAARVNVICTGDVHFEVQSVREFLADFGIAVVTDRDLLALLR